MTYLPPDGPQPELATTRVASGSSARLIAVGVAGVLMAVVGFTVVNRPAPPTAPAPSSPAVAAAPAGVPTASPPRNQLEGNDGIFGWPVVSQLGSLDRPVKTNPRGYTYAAVVQITGGAIMTALTQDVPEDYRSSVVLESTDVGKLLPIEIGRQWTVGGLSIYESFASWHIRLKPLLGSRRGQVALLVEHSPPDVTPGLPGPLASGFTFTVIGKRVGSQLHLFLELVWPDSVQFASFGGPRDPALYNRCRWDVGPLAAQPHPGTNEADC